MLVRSAGPFTEVRQDDCNEPSSQHGLAVNKKHAESPEARSVGPWDVTYIDVMR
jgi:hypothetical protein